MASTDADSGCAHIQRGHDRLVGRGAGWRVTEIALDHVTEDLMRGDAPLVLPFSALTRESIELAGGKAANLGELARAGFPVPPGFCVTTAAYTRVAGAAAPLVEALARLPPGEAVRRAALAEGARAALLASPLPGDVAAEISSAYRALGDSAAVAVRSSATAEDLPDASFAGQQDTYLNVVGEAAVLDATRRCFASLFTERAVAYRAQNRVDERAVRLAVVVQRMVDARAAGVLFTADPVTGRRHRAVIDASFGLGEAVVSGAVNPDHFEVDPASGEVVSRRLGDKAIAIEASADGGTRHVSRESTGDPAVSDAELAALARLGARVEAHYGAPQDTEWAIDRAGTLWLLQARPITTLYPLPAGADPDGALKIYFNFNVAQGVLRPLTPMGRQCWRLFGAGLAARVGFPQARPEAGPPFLTESAGRLMFDVTRILQDPIGRRAVEFVFSRMEARSAEMLRPLFIDPRLVSAPHPRRKLLGTAAKILVKTRAPVHFLRALAAPAAARRAAAQAAEQALALGHTPEGASAGEKLAAAEALLYGGVGQMFPLVFPAFVTGLLCFVLAKRLLRGRASPAEVDAVLRALPHNPTTEMDLALFALAREMRSDAAVRALLVGESPHELAKRYRDKALPPALQQGLEGFLARYGARGVAEIDIGVARWSEDPTHILGSLANYLALDDSANDPHTQFAHAAEEAETAVTKLLALAPPGRRTLLRFCLSRTRSLAGLREAPKFYLVRLLSRARALLLAVGEEVVRRGRLDAADGAFFLDLPELKEALGGGLDARPLVRERRARFEQEIARRRLPRVLLSDGTEPEPPRPPSEGGLSGTPASAGVVRGRARVVSEPTGARLEPGEILVAPSTDPGWTPLFLTAGGLVMEMGGAMSHGAVVAREYGIPAVVGVAHATERISTGQEIVVDGSSGTIALAPRP